MTTNTQDVFEKLNEMRIEVDNDEDIYESDEWNEVYGFDKEDNAFCLGSGYWVSINEITAYAITQIGMKFVKVREWKRIVPNQDWEEQTQEQDDGRQVYSSLSIRQ